MLSCMTRKITILSVIIIFFILPLAVTSDIVKVNSNDIITENYSLPGQTWTLIEISNLTSNQLTDYEWSSELIVQGRQVTLDQYTTFQGLGLTERSEYFETIGYTENKYDNGRTTTSDSGKLWFIFFNPHTESSTLDFSFTYRSSNYEPWKIGLITTIITIVILSIVLYLTMKFRK